MHRSIFTWALFAATLLKSLQALFALTPYEPAESPTLIESWRWHELEPLRSHILLCGDESQDGNLWFASLEGLVSYDGYRTQVHPYPDEFPNPNVYQLFAANNGTLYVYTATGIYSFADRKWDKPMTFQTNLGGPNHNFARSAYGTECVGTPNGIFQITDKGLIQIDEIDISSAEIAFDASNRLWLTRGPINEIVSYQFDEGQIRTPIEKREYKFRFGKPLSSRIIANPKSNEVWLVNWRQEIRSFRYSNESDEWIREDLSDISGSNNHSGGLRLDEDNLIIYSKTNLVLRHKDQSYSIEYPQFTIPTNRQFSFLRKNGSLILCGQGEPIYEIDFSSNRWETLKGLHFQCETSEKRMWFISLDGRIIERNSVYETWSEHIANVIDTPLVLIRSKDDYIWAAGSHRGVPAISYYDGRKWTRNQHPELYKFVSHLSAKQLSNGDILFGSGGDDITSARGGAIRYRKEANTYRFEYINRELSPQRPVGIAEQSSNKLWFGGIGLSTTDIFGKTAPLKTPPFHNEAWIDHIVNDLSSNIWLGIWGRGLFQFDEEKWIRHKPPEAINSDQVVYLMPDAFREDSLWVATNRGISRFDGENWFPNAIPQQIRLNRESGTLRQSQNGDVWINAATRDWYFRESTGFKLTKRLHQDFQTVRYRLDDAPPTVQIATYENEFVEPANVYLRWSGRDKWSLTPQAQLRYSYKINDSPWTPFSHDTETSLLDLPTGENNFQVRAMDTDGNISHQPSLASITIVPPLWLRPWFITLAVLLVSTIGILMVLLFRQRIQHIVQLEEFKIQFFTNISHELRTPLTVILGPLEAQLAKLPKDLDKGPLQLAYKNAQKMLLLIDQILDFRSAELGNIKLNFARSDLFASVKEAVHLITPLADYKHQEISINVPQGSHIAWFDSEKLEKIVSNLLSNAIKYTQNHGEIHVTLTLLEEDETTEFKLIVEDNGRGIPQKKIDSIFQLFYRAGDSENAKIRGSGIGLAYTKNLIEACSGEISVESPIATVNGIKQGTRFIVSLPLQTLPPQNESLELIERNPDEAQPHSETNASDKPLILIAEDDEDIRNFLRGELSSDFDIVTAADGEEALQHATLRLPDLILTDVMMPVIDGKELCKRIKNTEASCHIPVIMLTALKSHDHELEGLELGADDYLSKPIQIHILKQRIQNQLESQKRLQKRYLNADLAEPIEASQVTSNPLDERFMTKAIETVEAHMQDVLFDVEFFAKSMGMSRMTLYRKFKAITGDSPSEFIRAQRMKKAATLLVSNLHNVSEVSDLVGVSDLSYFSTLFKKRFKVSPSQYMARHSKID